MPRKQANSFQEFNNAFKVKEEKLPKKKKILIRDKKNNTSRIDEQIIEGEFNTYYRVTDETQKEVSQLLQIIEFTPEQKKLIEDHHQAFNPNGSLNKYFENAGMHTTPQTRQNGPFMCYMMAEKKMSFQEAIHFLPGKEGYDQVVRDYQEFVKNHPVKKDATRIKKQMVNGVETEVAEPIPQEELDQNVEAWTKIFMKASDVFKDYELPNIDYSNPDEVEKHAFELLQLNAFQINTTQEFEMITKHSPVHALKAAGGSNTMAKKMDVFGQIQSFTALFGKAYAIDVVQMVQNVSNKVGKPFEDLARDRLHFAILGNQMKGRKMGNLYEKDDLTPIISGACAQTPYNMTFNKNEAKQLFYKNELNNKMPEAETAFQENKQIGREFYLQSMQYHSIEDFTINAGIFAKNYDDAESKAKWDAIFAKADDPAGLLAKIGEAGNVNCQKELDSLFREILIGDSRGSFYDKIGMKMPLNLFKVGGKTPEQLWGDKVKGMSEYEQENYYKTMIAKEILTGDKKIEIDYYPINDKFKFEAPVTHTAIQSEADMLKTLPTLTAVYQLNKKLRGYLTELEATGKHASETYKPFIAALKTCVEKTNIKDGLSRKTGNIKEVLDSLKELKRASKVYYENHTGIYGLYKAIKSNGVKRRDTSKKLMDELRYDIGNINHLFKEKDFLFEKANPAPPITEGNYKIEKIWNQLKKNLVARGYLTGNMKGATDEQILESFAGVGTAFEKNSKISTLSEKNTKIMKCKSDILANYDKLQATANALYTPTEKQLFRLNSLYEENPVEAAQEIVKNHYVEKMKHHRDEDINLEMNRDNFEKKFHYTVDALLKNKNFNDIFDKDPKNAVKNYEEFLVKLNKEKHQKLAAENEFYRDLKAKSPENFEKRWNIAEERLAIWKVAFKDEMEVIKNQMEELNNDLSGLAIRPVEAHKATRDALKDKYAELLTMELISAKDSSIGMHIAMFPDRKAELKQDVMECLNKDKNLFVMRTDVDTVLDEQFKRTVKVRVCNHIIAKNQPKVVQAASKKEIKIEKQQGKVMG